MEEKKNPYDGITIYISGLRSKEPLKKALKNYHQYDKAYQLYLDGCNHFSIKNYSAAFEALEKCFYTSIEQGFHPSKCYYALHGMAVCKYRSEEIEKALQIWRSVYGDYSTLVINLEDVLSCWRQENDHMNKEEFLSISRLPY